MSAHSNELIDQEVERILKKVSIETQEILDQNWDKLLLLKEKLEEDMKLDLSDIQNVLGKRPGKHRANFAEFQKYMS